MSRDCKILLLLLAVIISTTSLAGCTQAAKTQADKPLSAETKKQKDARMQWWQDARFGMFIHWGLYAIPAGQWKGKTNHAEWIRHSAHIPIDEYDKFVDQFNPTQFNAEQWVRMAKDAGMKYIVITSKHHDGFSLYDSSYTDYDVMSTPFKRDILKELSVACRKQGVKFCFYHSIMDWHHPDYLPRRGWEKRSSEGADYQRYITYMKAQLKELVTRYDPAVLWFDGEWEGTWTHEEGLKLYDYVRSLKPDIIINNRVDKGRSGMRGMTRDDSFAGDFGTPEQEVPHTGLSGVDWESCITMNNHWGYNSHDKNFKSTKFLIHQLVDIVSKGGNYLLNIGPTAKGTFPQESIDRLSRMGKWMKLNGQSIYGTTASPLGKLPWGRCTAKPGKLYLHVFDWPKDGRLLVPGLKNEVSRTWLLANKSRLKTTASEDGLVVELPKAPLDEIDTVIVLKVKGALKIERILPKPNAEGNVVLQAKMADIHGGQAKIETKNGRQNIGFWLDERTSVQWQFKIDKPGTFKIAADVASVSPSVFDLTVAGKTTPCELAATGSYDKFDKVRLGTVKIDKAGVHLLKIVPRRTKWAPINIRSIILSKN